MKIKQSGECAELLDTNNEIDLDSDKINSNNRVFSVLSNIFLNFLKIKFS